MHAALMGRAEPEGAGRWRDQQVWIGAPGPVGLGDAYRSPMTTVRTVPSSSLAPIVYQDPAVDLGVFQL